MNNTMDDEISDISGSDVEEVEVRLEEVAPKSMSSSTEPQKKSCCIPFLICVCIMIAALVGFLVWYFFSEDDPLSVASCGDCHCILKDNKTACPERPQVASGDSILAAALSTQRLLNNESLTLDCSPYKDADCKIPLDGGSFDQEEAVCGVHYQDTDCKEYQLKNYADRSTAEAAGAFVTHLGTCGACSTLQDLSVYLSVLDLTTVTKECSKKTITAGTSRRIECFQDLGMTLPCARMWAFNADNTIDECGLECFASDIQNKEFNGPPPTCPLDECLQCDEDNSGPIFQSYAGRTRRQSGLLSAIARPCDSIASIQHEACPETLPLER